MSIEFYASNGDDYCLILVILVHKKRYHIHRNIEYKSNNMVVYSCQQALHDLDIGFVNFFQKHAAHPISKASIIHPIILSTKVTINDVIIKCTPIGKYFAVLNWNLSLSSKIIVVVWYGNDVIKVPTYTLEVRSVK